MTWYSRQIACTMQSQCRHKPKENKNDCSYLNVTVHWFHHLLSELEEINRIQFSLSLPFRVTRPLKTEKWVIEEIFPTDCWNEQPDMIKQSSEKKIQVFQCGIVLQIVSMNSTTLKFYQMSSSIIALWQLVFVTATIIQEGAESNSSCKICMLL